MSGLYITAKASQLTVHEHNTPTESQQIIRPSIHIRLTFAPHSGAKAWDRVNNVFQGNVIPSQCYHYRHT